MNKAKISKVFKRVGVPAYFITLGLVFFIPFFINEAINTVALLLTAALLSAFLCLALVQSLKPKNEEISDREMVQFESERSKLSSLTFGSFALIISAIAIFGALVDTKSTNESMQQISTSLCNIELHITEESDCAQKTEIHD